MKTDIKSWPMGFQIQPRANGPRPEIVAAYEQVPTAHISDSLGRSVGGLGLRAMHGSKSLCGVAFTVRVRPGDNLMIHKAIELAQPGDVLVVDGSGDLTQALVGGLMRAAMMQSKLAGLVVNGAIRDLSDWQQGDFPVFALGNTHRGPTKEGPGEINVPISCAGLVVAPGDLVVGDLDGVVAMAPRVAERLLDLVRTKAETERALMEKIVSGNLPLGRFDQLLREKGCPI